jgi:hydroxypyruvate reductase
MEFGTGASEKLLDAGTNIVELNLVRTHLSKVKGGGRGPSPTFVLSDVAGAGPGVVSSGPTIGIEPDPEGALEIMRRAGVNIATEIEDVVRSNYTRPRQDAELVVLADGKTAARGVSDSVDDQIASRVRTAWIEGDLRESLIEFIATATSGVTVAAGEPSVPAGPGGRGGRNTHAALAAATMIDGTGMTFASFATDGVDGRSGAAGAIVDGTTVSRGGDPTSALAQFDSATYLEATGDLIEIGPTGTNVADLWLIWKPEDGSEPILSV